MTDLEVLNRHIERQLALCNVATLRLEALQLARSHLTELRDIDPPIVTLKLSQDHVLLSIQLDEATQALDSPPAQTSDVQVHDTVKPEAERAADGQDDPPAHSAIPPVVTTPSVPLAPTPITDGSAAVLPDDVDHEPAPKIDNRKAVAQEWSDKEIAELRRRFKSGDTTAQIARAINKAPKQVSNKAFRIGLRRSKPSSDQALPVKAVPHKATAHAAPRTVLKSKPQQGIAQRLDALGNSKLWTPEADLDLALAFVRGDSAVKIAKGLLLDPSDVTDRWQSLCPNRNDKSAVNALVRELKVRANA